MPACARISRAPGWSVAMWMTLSPRSGMPRPAWKSTGSRCSAASSTTCSTTRVRQPEVVAARVQLEAARAGLEAAARLVQRVGRVGVDARQRDEPPVGLRAGAQHPGVGLAVAVGLVHREDQRLAAGRRRRAPRRARAGRPRSRRGRCGRCACGRRTSARRARPSARSSRAQVVDDVVVGQCADRHRRARYPRAGALASARRLADVAQRAAQLAAQAREPEPDAALGRAERDAGAPRRSGRRSGRPSRRARAPRAAGRAAGRAPRGPCGGRRDSSAAWSGRSSAAARSWVDDDLQAVRRRGRRPGPRATGRRRGCGPSAAGSCRARRGAASNFCGLRQTRMKTSWTTSWAWAALPRTR